MDLKITGLDQTKLTPVSPVIKIDTSQGTTLVHEYEILKLIAETSPFLRTPTQDFDYTLFDRFKGSAQFVNPVYLANSLWETMLFHRGLGLAAPQCGIPFSVFVLGADKVTKNVLFNPVIIQESSDKELSEEGCLTYKHLFVKVPRAKAIRVQFQDLKGETQTQDYVGLTARIVQHEIDHLRGRQFWENAGGTSLAMARKRRVKLLKKDERRL